MPRHGFLKSVFNYPSTKAPPWIVNVSHLSNYNYVTHIVMVAFVVNNYLHSKKREYRILLADTLKYPCAKSCTV